jgi:hypothetical protein
MHDEIPTRSNPDLGAVWLDRIARYRRDPLGGAGPEIVETLLPQLRRMAANYRSLPGSVETEDVLHQLVIEVLVGAREMKLPGDPYWIPRRLMLRARTYVSRWLTSEVRQLGLPMEWVEGSLTSRAAPGGISGSSVPRPGPSAEFIPHRNHAWATQKPRSSARFRGLRLWINRVGPKEGRRST